MKNQKVLIIDDNNENIKVAANFIKENNITVWAALDPNEGIKIAEKKSPDLILLDIQMPNLDGYEACKILKDNDKTRDIPVIFMTARTDDESIDKAYKTGAVDYITKPIKKMELLARVKTHLKLAQLIIDLKKASYTDGLTRLFNHKKILEVLEQEKERAERYNKTFSIMMADIDFFKKVNDNYGHVIGDVVLEKVAAEIKHQIRDIDVAGRYGGEEFLMIFPEIDRDNAYIAAERLRKSIEALEFDQGLKVTISGGIVEYKEIESSKLVEIADDNLYKAKEGGRNQIVG